MSELQKILEHRRRLSETIQPPELVEPLGTVNATSNGPAKIGAAADEESSKAGGLNRRKLVALETQQSSAMESEDLTLGSTSLPEKNDECIIKPGVNLKAVDGLGTENSKAERIPTEIDTSTSETNSGLFDLPIASQGSARWNLRELPAANLKEQPQNEAEVCVPTFAYLS
jgi:hypothetical protein